MDALLLSGRVALDLQLTCVQWTAGASWIFPYMPLPLSRVALLQSLTLIFQAWSMTNTHTQTLTASFSISRTYTHTAKLYIGLCTPLCFAFLVLCII